VAYIASAQELSVADPVENGTDYDLELSQSSFVLPKLQRLAIAAQPFKMSLPALTKLTGLKELYVGGARWCFRGPAERASCLGQLPHSEARIYVFCRTDAMRCQSTSPAQGCV
jgi:hypothetical protein